MQWHPRMTAEEVLDYAREHWQPKPGPIVLSQEYLEFLRIVADLPQNRWGADKSWVERAQEEWDEHYEKVWAANRRDAGLPPAGPSPG